MAMDLGGAKGGVKSDINVTPLCDVMLVLLIIMMISSTSMTPLCDVMLVLLIIMMIVAPLLQQGISVTLPTADNTVDKPETQGQTVLAISKDKQYYVNAKPVTEGEMASRVSELLENQKEKVVLIKADVEAEYASVMAAMDQLRQAGIEDIGLVTDPKRRNSGGN